jgi:hypothetical protein
LSPETAIAGRGIREGHLLFAREAAEYLHVGSRIVIEVTLARPSS